MSAVEFFFLFLRQCMHQDRAVTERSLRMAAMRTNVLTHLLARAAAEVELIDLKRPTATEIGTAFEFHSTFLYGISPIQRNCLEIIFSQMQRDCKFLR